MLMKKSFLLYAKLLQVVAVGEDVATCIHLIKTRFFSKAKTSVSCAARLFS
jgi:hypothetical protein